MPDAGPATFRGAIGLRHHGGRVAQQDIVGLAERLRDGERVDQREPFGLHAGAVPQVMPDMRPPAHHDRDLHRAGIGAAAAIEEDVCG